MAASMSSDPTKVKMTNLMAAYRRRSPPQMPMMKYIGINISSQNT